MTIILITGMKPRAELIVSWFKKLRHSKGELAGQPINLTEWQQFHLCQLYGWKRKADGRRRFKKMFIEVSRKNAKSQELAGICLMEISYISTKNNEVAEAYTAGVKRDSQRLCLMKPRDAERFKTKAEIQGNQKQN